MSNLGFIPLSFGYATALPVDDRLREFYRWLASQVFDEDCELCAPASEAKLTIPFVVGEGREGQIFTKITQYADSWDANVDLFLVDVMVHPDSVLGSNHECVIAGAIQQILVRDQKCLRKCVMLARNLLSPPDPALKVLATHINDGSMIIIDHAGNQVPGSAAAISPSKQLFQLHHAEACGPALTRFKHKLIKRHGHFRRRGPGREFCFRTAYDGSFCAEEIYMLLKGKVKERFVEQLPSLILYDDEPLGWVFSPVSRLAANLGVACVPVGEFLSEGSSQIVKSTSPPLIVVSMVDTFSTLGGYLENLRPKMDTPKPHIVSVLSTTGQAEELGTVKKTAGGEEYLVDYLIKVDRPRWDKVEDCPMHRLSQPLYENYGEEYYELTTYDIYAMADPDGWGPEPDAERPAHRKSSLPMVPRFHDLISENGAWLAGKVNFLIRREYDRPVLILCPKEPGSHALADYLSLIYGFTVVGIPKDGFINRLLEDSSNVDSLLDEHDGNGDVWLRQLRTAESMQAVVLLEEYVVSGGTARRLLKLANKLNLDAKCHVSVVDFDPNGLRSRGVPSHSLYSLQLDLPGQLTETD